MSEPLVIEVPAPPITQVQAEISDGRVVAWGYFPLGAPGETIAIVDIYDQAEADKLQQPGEKHIDLDTGVITVTPPPPPSLRYLNTIRVEANVSTVNDTPTTIFTLPTEIHQMYRANVMYMGCTPTMNAVFSRETVDTCKRAAVAPIHVGTVEVSSIPEQPSADWNTRVVVSGNNILFQVIGERTGAVNWLILGRVDIYVPAGF